MLLNKSFEGVSATDPAAMKLFNKKREEVYEIIQEFQETQIFEEEEEGEEEGEGEGEEEGEGEGEVEEQFQLADFFCGSCGFCPPGISYCCNKCNDLYCGDCVNPNRCRNCKCKVFFCKSCNKCNICCQEYCPRCLDVKGDLEPHQSLLKKDFDGNYKSPFCWRCGSGHNIKGAVKPKKNYK